jgi:hypothetical protein
MKKLKIIQITGVLILLLGVIIRAGAGEYYGTALGLFGLVIYVVARLTLWVKSNND